MAAFFSSAGESPDRSQWTDARIESQIVWNDHGAIRVGMIVEASRADAKTACFLQVSDVNSDHRITRTRVVDVPPHFCNPTPGIVSVEPKLYQFDAKTTMCAVRYGELHQGYGGADWTFFRLTGEGLIKNGSVEIPLEPESPYPVALETETSREGPYRLAVLLRKGRQTVSRVPYVWSGDRYIEQLPSSAK
ncbi:hypothetical protein [Anaeromyxobacter oryzae]|nr:hypothetical protein [Anaeromyxobacter oryzae]